MNRDKEGIPFSHDQHDFQKSNAQTPAEALNRSILGRHEIEYLLETSERFEDTEVYKALAVIGLELNEQEGDSRRIGQSFVHGAVVGMDFITRFAPYLMPRTEASILTHIDKQAKKFVVYEGTDEILADAKQRAYLEAVTHAGGRTVAEHGRDYERLIQRLAASYYAHTAQHDSMKNGFRFFMAHAERAQEDDRAELEHIIRIGGNIISAAELDDELKVFMAQQRYT